MKTVKKNMSIKSPPTLHAWNDFVKSQPLGSLYQTSIWAHFQAQIPGKEKTMFITVTDPHSHSGGEAHSEGVFPPAANHTLLGGGLIIIRSLPLGLAWIECPRGPVFRSDLTEAQLEYFFKNFFEQVKMLTSEYNIVHIRIDSPIQRNSPFATTYESIMNHFHLRPAHASYTPDTTLVIDLTLSEEEMLKQMKPKGRYNIGVAKKHGIIVKHVTKDHIKEFYDLIAQTGMRDGFSTHNLAYYTSMLDSLSDSSALWMAYTRATPDTPSQPIAALIATYFTDTVTYYYGASSSSPQDRNLMAPYLLQWEVMRDAKEKGYKKYDLLGIATPTPEPKAKVLFPIASPPSYKFALSDPLIGVTDFKLKFGGRITQYIPAKELVYKPFWYALVRLRKWLRS